jgi:hypothetical protein
MPLGGPPCGPARCRFKQGAKTYEASAGIDHGVYMGAAPTQAKALQAGRDALERWDFKTMKKKRPERR